MRQQCNMNVNSEKMGKITIEKEMMALANCKKLLLMGKKKIHFIEKVKRMHH